MTAIIIVIAIVLIYVYMRKDGMRCKHPNIMNVASARLSEIPANMDAQFYMDLERKEIAPCMDDFAEVSHMRKRDNGMSSLRMGGDETGNSLEMRGVKCGGRGIYCGRRPRFG